jgi:hypothetical protein
VQTLTNEPTVSLEALYRQAVDWAADSEDALILFRLCFAGRDTGFEALVQESCERGDKLLGGSADEYRYLGEDRFYYDDFRMATFLLEEAAARAPSAEVYQLLGDGYRQQSRFEEAAASYERAFEYDPSEWVQTGIYDNRAEMFIVWERFDEAQADIDALAAIEGNSGIVGILRVQLAVARGDYEEGIELATAIINSGGEYANYSYLMRMAAYASLGEPELALEDYRDYLGYRLDSGSTITESVLAPGEARRVEMAYDRVIFVPFDAEAGDVITAEITRPPESDVDSVMILLDPEGFPIAGNDDSLDFDAVLPNVRLPVNGRYTLVVSHAGGASDGPIYVNLSVTQATDAQSIPLS